MSNIHIAGSVLCVGFSLDGEKQYFEFLFCSSTSGSSGAFLVWLYCLWMMRWCSICRCHRRWCQVTLVVAQLASQTGYQSSSALRLCVPHACHSPLLCWPASSEAEAAFLTSNLKCSFILSPCFHITSVVRSIPWLFHQMPHFPFFYPLTTEVQSWLQHLLYAVWSAHLIFALTGSLHLIIPLFSDNHKGWRGRCGC